MYRFQQRNWLQRQQMQEEEEREKALRSAEAAQRLKDAEYESLKTQYQNEKPSGGLLFPTSYHLQKTVTPAAAAAAAAAAAVASSSPPPPASLSDPRNVRMSSPPSLPGSFHHHPSSVHHGQTQYSPMAPNSYFNAPPIKQEIVDEHLYPLDGSESFGREDIFSETSSIDQDYDFSGVPSTTMSPFDPGMGNDGYNDGDVTANYLDFGGSEMDTDDYPQNLSSSAPSSIASPKAQPVKPTARAPGKGKAAPVPVSSLPESVPGPIPGNFKFDFSDGTAFSTPVSGSLVKLEDTRPSTSERPFANAANRSMDDLVNEKKKKRRESHNAVERRRRDHINDRINELSELVPDCTDPTQPQGKANKGVVLKKSADYIRQLQETNRRLQQLLQQQQQQQQQQPMGSNKMVQAVSYPNGDAHGQSHPESIS